MIKILQNPRNSFLFVFITAVFKSLFFEKLRLMQWVWAHRRAGEMYCQPNQILWHLYWKQAWKWDSNSCFIQICWCNWPLGRNRLKTKTDNNKTRRCSGQQPLNHRVLYTTGTDSIQQDRPLSKKRLTQDKETDSKQKTDSISKPGFTKLGFTDAQKCVPDASKKYTKCCPQAVHFTYSQYLSPRNPTTEWWRACLR